MPSQIWGQVIARQMLQMALDQPADLSRESNTVSLRCH